MWHSLSYQKIHGYELWKITGFFTRSLLPISIFFFFFLQCNKNEWRYGREEKALGMEKVALLEFTAMETKPNPNGVAQIEGF